jgi:thiol-disulfide isomerase/thioredoxin
MRLLFLFIVLAAVGGGLAAPAQTQSPSASKTRQPGPFVLDGIDRNDLPAIREIDLEGLKKILQRDPKDTRPLLINFWATWCDGCREEFPDLVKGLNFVSVSLDDILDIKTKVPDFLKQVKAEMPVVLLNVNDPEPAIHFVDPNWQGDMPATFLYDKDGKIVFKYFGAIKPAQLRGEIDKLVKQQQAVRVESDRPPALIKTAH